ncbi:hypothetical protein RHIZ404_210181 [Rhizobium sp. EC-SD404]|nr:hypothetical protein RHIZ404_210181 [Rhizobium sp. EC-SD404]
MMSALMLHVNECDVCTYKVHPLIFRRFWVMTAHGAATPFNSVGSWHNFSILSEARAVPRAFCPTILPQSMQIRP